MAAAAPTEAAPETLAALLDAAAERWPDRPALEAAGRIWRYGELAAAVERAADWLAAAGIGPGDRLATALGHNAAHLAVPFVASRLGASALLLSTASAPERWAWQLATLRPSALLADPAQAAALRALEPSAPVHVVDADDPGLGAPAHLEPAGPPPAGAGDDPAATVLYLGTSGTTGAPKLTALTERGLLHAARGYLPHVLLDAGERSLVVMPLHYIGPITAQSVVMPLVGGCSVVADDPRPGPVADRLAAEAITHLDAVPAWLARLAPRLRERPRAWRSVIYGGAPMPPATVAQLAERAPGLALFDVWGLSEAHGPVTLQCVGPGDPPTPGVVGRPLSGLTVRAMAEGAAPDEPGAVCAPGEVGALWIAGPSITPGYLGDPQATAAALCRGWLATGDLGSVAADGAVRLLGRRKEVILRGGANVFPVEVEQVLAAVPGVAEAAVFAVPSAVTGEAVAAAVVGDEIRPGALRRAVRERIGAHAVPRRISVVDALPRSATGKIDKAALAASLTEGGAAAV